MESIVERWSNVVHRDGVVGETKNAVEPCERWLIETLTTGYKLTHLPKAKARPGSLVASAKSWPSIVKSPIVMTSWET